MDVLIVRADGSEETRNLAFEQIAPAIGCDVTDIVNLRDGRIMIVDDNGHVKSETPPINRKATALYHSVCRPGTTHQIVGDVAIVVDADIPMEED